MKHALFGAALLATATVLGSTAPASADTPLVDVDWLQANLDRPDLVVLDIRNQIDGGSAETFAQGHIPGSVYSDYGQDGWRTTVDDIVGKLPPVTDLETLIGGLGIDNDEHVVIVPGGVSSTDFGSAARVYWTFKVLGHDAVSILEGGYAAWASDADAPVDTGATTTQPAQFVADFRPELLATTDQVRAAVDSGEVTLVDARPNDQYIGAAAHPKASQAGTLPGAVNLPHSTLVLQDGQDVVDGASLDTLLAKIGADDEGEQIAFCNTGHWAAVGWFALSEVAGKKDVRLYDGSMVEWTADADRPVQTGEGVAAVN